MDPKHCMYVNMPLVLYLATQTGKLYIKNFFKTSTLIIPESLESHGEQVDKVEGGQGGKQLNQYNTLFKYQLNCCAILKYTKDPVISILNS